MKWRFFAVLAGALLLSGGDDLVAIENDSVVELRAFISVPVRDRLDSALGAHDLRFLGVYGYSLEVPGVPETEAARISKNGVLAIPGTSDAVVSEEHGTLDEKARAYATEYNALLVRHLKKGAP
jgi:hypothetical protein